MDRSELFELLGNGANGPKNIVSLPSDIRKLYRSDRPAKNEVPSTKRPEAADRHTVVSEIQNSEEHKFS